ncbi:hypothetical protein ABEB36_004720 [Hypothenemus hampei]|uniref:Uncharacterized protein n=1 Tax=Hypothenemus hampei TaxID=57062 RepID=A0ABD1F7W0_HYPHA
MGKSDIEIFYENLVNFKVKLGKDNKERCADNTVTTKKWAILQGLIKTYNESVRLETTDMDLKYDDEKIREAQTQDIGSSNSTFCPLVNSTALPLQPDQLTHHLPLLKKLSSSSVTSEEDPLQITILSLPDENQEDIVKTPAKPAPLQRRAARNITPQVKNARIKTVLKRLLISSYTQTRIIEVSDHTISEFYSWSFEPDAPKYSVKADDSSSREFDDLVGMQEEIQNQLSDHQWKAVVHHSVLTSSVTSVIIMVGIIITLLFAYHTCGRTRTKRKERTKHQEKAEFELEMLQPGTSQSRSRPSTAKQVKNARIKTVLKRLLISSYTQTRIIEVSDHTISEFYSWSFEPDAPKYSVKADDSSSREFDDLVGMQEEIQNQLSDHQWKAVVHHSVLTSSVTSVIIMVGIIITLLFAYHTCGRTRTKRKERTKHQEKAEFELEMLQPGTSQSRSRPSTAKQKYQITRYLNSIQQESTNRQTMAATDTTISDAFWQIVDPATPKFVQPPIFRSASDSPSSFLLGYERAAIGIVVILQTRNKVTSPTQELGIVDHSARTVGDTGTTVAAIILIRAQTDTVRTQTGQDDSNRQPSGSCPT